MVSLSTIRAHNASLKSTLPPNLVAVFVGGTSGMGYSTARELVRNTTSPHIYLIGRNQTEASRIISELQSINPDSKLNFIKSDVSLLKGVDEACKEIAAKEKKVNLLFMTVGYLTMKGRNETPEGIDKKMSVHYYARMRFVQNLAPLLTTAAPELSRVVSVMDPRLGRGSKEPNWADLSLKTSFSLQNCATHTSAMQNYALEHFAAAYPKTSFSHAYPSMVDTGVTKVFGPIGQPFMKATIAVMKKLNVAIDLGESGERHLYAATAPQFAPRATAIEGVARGMDEVAGSGAYSLNWDGEVTGESKNAAKWREEGAVEKVWSHTEEVWRKIFGEGGKY
ncbi:hypothetical protein P154DRAFT_522343 [Amniculicola lignicola CBS 123094]|uniref:NAD(P)-binding protein n=1 Tax=Amniculicola lignicola CBS 123094 TaxID=1392246 RepID=A0A6A5WIW4_9PLEO|nr:hypothetical protein P154DRAFT_522343 [Amniculicola lignicola CBS 123094]